ncbi:hypothetical protein [Nitrosomonas sp. Nm166]|uniref:hypothetical protein n=1 Tax=Nitrosomonas sp. Nm166 TaxID=1881054 RepID=UPI0008E1B8C9|nr:hypothetical protein [Nitrosomonas sp. Nm166]SFF18600.1 hypothetical protein SAMN05428977_10668 [Nitrosomonas sp. Nm166]
MRTTKTMLPRLFLMMLLMFTLAAPTLAQAGRGHHGHGHGHHHGHHHHGHRHHQHHHVGYHFIYNQPRVYFSQPYFPRPRYNYYPSAPVYGYPPNVMMGIGTGNMDFMIRF